MADRNFMELVHSGWQAGKFVCVGLDPDWEKLPGNLNDPWSPKYKGIEGGLFAFNKAIIDATADIAAAYKPNPAFYECWGDLGIRALEATIKYILGLNPVVPVILDAKYGDIGNTNNGYVEGAFRRPTRYQEVVEDGQKRNYTFRGADAVTVHNYMGSEAMKPFLEDPNKGVIVLCKTSNPGSGEFQDLQVDIGELQAVEWGLVTHHGSVAFDDAVVRWPKPKLKLYEVVAHRVTKTWNYNGNCGLVVGATYPKQMKEIRAIAPTMPFLIPGVGAQGVDLVASVRAGMDSSGSGFLINSGSADLFASKGKDFASATRARVQKSNDAILAAIAA